MHFDSQYSMKFAATYLPHLHCAFFLLLTTTFSVFSSLSSTCVWLKTLLSYHLSHFLRNSSEVQQQLIVAKAAIATRLRSQEKLESLAGRLELLMTQMSKTSNIAISKDFNDVVEGEEDEENSEDEDEEIEEAQESSEDEEISEEAEDDDDDDDDIADLLDA